MKRPLLFECFLCSRCLLKFWLKVKCTSCFEEPFWSVVKKVSWKEWVTEFEQNWRLVGFPTSGFWKKSELLLTCSLWEVSHKMMYRLHCFWCCCMANNTQSQASFQGGMRRKTQEFCNKLPVVFWTPGNTVAPYFSPHAYGKAPQSSQNERAHFTAWACQWVTWCGWSYSIHGCSQSSVCSCKPPSFQRSTEWSA